MSTLCVFTAEVIKVVRAGLDKEQDKVGDVFETDSHSFSRKEFANS